MTNQHVARFFREQHISLLLDPTFVLKLESEMLFPESHKEGLALDYATFLGLKAGPETLPPPPAPIASGPPLRGRASMGGKPSPVVPSLDLDSLYWPDTDLNWRGDLGQESNLVSLPPKPRRIHVDLQTVNMLRPFRVAMDLSRSMGGYVADSVRHRTADGLISAICLDMFRLLAGKTFSTKKGRVAEPSLGLVAFVCQRHNLGRPKPGRGRPSKDSDTYPNLVEKNVKEIWRQYEECSALWAAYRALSPDPFYAPPSGHLLARLDADQFLGLALAFEQERQALRRDRWSHTPPSALGREAAFSELRGALDQHVPTYFVHK